MGMLSCIRGNGLDSMAFTLVRLPLVGCCDLQQRLIHINERGVNVTPDTKRKRCKLFTSFNYCLLIFRDHSSMSCVLVSVQENFDRNK